MKLDKREFDKPILRMADGKFATLKEILKEPATEVLSVAVSLGPEDYRELAIERFKKMDPTKELHVLGKGSFTKDQIVLEIQRGTETGKIFVKMQEKFVRYLLNRREEIDVS
jgi:hypothetical protein